MLYYSSDSSSAAGGHEQPIDLCPKKVSNLCANSCSRENFASKLVKELFTAEERMTSNVKGVMEKETYDESKTAHIQRLTFEHFHCGTSEQMPLWAKCVKAIDSASRSLCHQLKKENQMPM